MQNHFARIIKAANIADANYHALRHTFATRCIEAGVDVKSLSEILGHANVNITLNRYVHSSFEQKRESMNKLERYTNN
jgi:integrase